MSIDFVASAQFPFVYKRPKNMFGKVGIGRIGFAYQPRDGVNYVHIPSLGDMIFVANLFLGDELATQEVQDAIIAGGMWLPSHNPRVVYVDAQIPNGATLAGDSFGLALCMATYCGENIDDKYVFTGEMHKATEDYHVGPVGDFTTKLRALVECPQYILVSGEKQLYFALKYERQNFQDEQARAWLKNFDELVKTETVMTPVRILKYRNGAYQLRIEPQLVLANSILELIQMFQILSQNGG